MEYYQFDFYDPDEEIGLAGLDIPQELIIAHMDPFFAECRAYGCIEANGRNGDVAVRCHGFIGISTEREKELDKKFGIVGWERPEKKDGQAQSTRAPLRAIVKELISDDIPFTRKMIRQMKADLLALRRMRVFVRDVQEDNYKGGKLVDFSVSWTDPHIMMSERYCNKKTIERDRDWELREFDNMIKQSGLSNLSSIRAAPNPEYVNKLRLRKEDELDKILDKRTRRKGRSKVLKTQYKVRWKGYGSEHDAWMDESELQNAKGLLQDYESTIATARRRKSASTTLRNARTPPSSKAQSPITARKKRGRPKKKT